MPFSERVSRIFASHRLLGGGGGQSRLAVAFAGKPGRGRQLFAIRRQDRGAAIGRKIEPLGVDQHLLLGRVAVGDDVLQDPGRERALAVIGQNDDVGAIHRPDCSFEQAILDVALEGRRVFLVDAHDLLPGAEHAQLAGRRTPRDRDEPRGVDRAKRVKALDQTVPRAILSSGADNVDEAAQRRDVGRDIGRAAGNDFFR